MFSYCSLIYKMLLLYSYVCLLVRFNSWAIFWMSRIAVLKNFPKFWTFLFLHDYIQVKHILARWYVIDFDSPEEAHNSSLFHIGVAKFDHLIKVVATITCGILLWNPTKILFFQKSNFIQWLNFLLLTLHWINNLLTKLWLYSLLFQWLY